MPSNHDHFREKADKILSLADIKINGSRLWDIKILNQETYQRVFAKGTLGLGESYMDGWWDCDSLDQFIYKIYTNRLEKELVKVNTAYYILKAKLFNLQSASRAFQVGEKHYDAGNDLYRLMLDKNYLLYTSGYWKNAPTLEKSIEDKLELICQKLKLSPGMKVLDIGCGWGGLAKYMAEKYNVEVDAVTVSKEQLELAQKTCEGLPVKFLLKDYRNMTFNTEYDRIASIGMLEHVGPKNYKNYFEIINRYLKTDGLFILESFSSYSPFSQEDPWFDKYIFPNGTIPRLSQIISETENIFVVEDCHNYGDDYDKTLMAWHKNFTANWSKIMDKYDERFFRMWSYYLLVLAGLFRARAVQNWQVVFSKNGVKGGYSSVR